MDEQTHRIEQIYKLFDESTGSLVFELSVSIEPFQSPNYRLILNEALTLRTLRRWIGAVLFHFGRRPAGEHPETFLLLLVERAMCSPSLTWTGYIQPGLADSVLKWVGERGKVTADAAR